MSAWEPTTHKGLFGLGLGWLLAILAAIALAVVAVWAFRTATADVAGQAGAYRAKVSAVNRVQKQEQFEQIAANFEGYVVQIVNAEVALENASPETKAQRETELLGLRQVCVSAAQQFNAESRKYTSRDWKSAGLPATLDPLACQGR